MTGSLNWQQQLPSGNLSAQLSRAVSLTNQDVEQLTTSVNLKYNQAVNQNSSVSFSLGYALTDPEGVANETANTTFGATYSWALTADWNLDVGYNYRMRDQTGFGQATSNSVSLTLQRSFSIRP